LSISTGMPEPEAYVSGPFRIVPTRQELLRDGAPVPLGGRAFDVLRTLVERSGRLVTKRELFAAVWPGLAVEENNLAVAVSAVRRALGCCDETRYIATVAGRGYRYVAPVRLEASRPADTPERNTNLPAPLGSLIGRERDVAAVRDLLAGSRLVTVTGAGGVGKTRLSLAVGAEVAAEFPDGIWFVELAALAAAELVGEAIAATLGLALQEGRAAPEMVALYLGRRKVLLILDNCEHLIGEVSRVASTVLGACPDATILATSREALRLPGEQIYRLPSLAFPLHTDALTAKAALEYGAVQLFVDRAGQASAGFRITDETAPAVAEICRRLDGIALAIELAAPRLRVVSLAEFLDRIEDRFGLLASGSRTAQPRHQTLRGLIDWSYGLLSADEQAMLRRLSIFAGGFTLESAVAVSPDDAQEWVVFDILASLVDKSLLVADLAEHATRYRLLESTRSYAAERRQAAGEGDIEERHARCMARLARQADADYETQSTTTWIATYAAELDNLRSALVWAFGPGGEPDLGIAIVAYGRHVWGEQGLVPELRRWVDIASTHWRDDLPPDVGARLKIARTFRPVYGLRSVQADLRDALTLARRTGDPILVARVVALAATNDLRPEKVHQAIADLSEAIEAVRGHGVIRSLAVLTSRLGVAAESAGDTDRARRCFREAIRIAEALGNRRIQVTVRSNLAELLFAQGEVDAAVEMAREALALARSANLQVNVCQTGINLGAYLLLRGETAEATSLLISSLALARSLDEEFLALSAVQHLALTLVRRGEARMAARLLGRVDAVYEREATVRESTERATMERLRAELCAVFSEVELAALVAEGTALPLDEAIEAALSAR